MGSYGIGVGRNVACIVEAHHDDKGIVWPAEVAPYAAHLVSIGSARDPKVDEIAERLHAFAIASRPRDPVGRPRRVAGRQVHRRRAARHAVDPDGQPALAGRRRGRGHRARDRRALDALDRGRRGAARGRAEARATRGSATRGSGRRPVRPARPAGRREPGGDRGRLARAAPAPPSGRGRPCRTGTSEADQRRPRLAERPGLRARYDRERGPDRRGVAGPMRCGHELGRPGPRGGRPRASATPGITRTIRPRRSPGSSIGCRR